MLGTALLFQRGLFFFLNKTKALLCGFSSTGAKLCALRFVNPSLKAFNGFGLGFERSQRNLNLCQVFGRKAQRLNFLGQCNLCRDIAFFLGNRHLALEDVQLLGGLGGSLGFVFGFLAGFINLVVLFAQCNLLVQSFDGLGFIAQHIKLSAQSTGLLSVVNKLLFLGRGYVLCLHRLKAGDGLLNARSLLHCSKLILNGFLLVCFSLCKGLFFLLFFQLGANGGGALVVCNYGFVIVRLLKLTVLLASGFLCLNCRQVVGVNFTACLLAQVCHLLLQRVVFGFGFQRKLRSLTALGFCGSSHLLRGAVFLFLIHLGQTLLAHVQCLLLLDLLTGPTNFGHPTNSAQRPKQTRLIGSLAVFFQRIRTT